MVEDYFQIFSHFGWIALIFYISPLIASGVFLKKDQNENSFIHYAVSLHGALVVAVFLFSWVINLMEFSNDNWPIFLNFVMVLAFVSVIFSFFKFTGNKQYHLLHLITLAVGPYLWFVATMAITDRWL